LESRATVTIGPVDPQYLALLTQKFEPFKPTAVTTWD
jgi:hypothetical protein